MNSFHNDFNDGSDYWHFCQIDFDDDGENPAGRGDLDWPLVGDSIIARVAFPSTTNDDQPQNCKSRFNEENVYLWKSNSFHYDANVESGNTSE